MTPFGKFCREQRMKRGLKLKDQAEKLGISSAFISALEHGKKGLPPGDYLNKLERYWGLTEVEANQMLAASNHSIGKFKFWSARPALYELHYEMMMKSGHLTDKQIEDILIIFKSIELDKGEK